MFFRLSTVSRFVVLQTLLILLMILTVIGGLKYTGRGKYVDPTERDTAYYVSQNAPVAGWLRDHGWMLLAIPFALAIARLRQTRFSPEQNGESALLIALCICFTLVFIGLGIYATCQAFEDDRPISLTGKSKTATQGSPFRPPRDY